MVTGKQSETSVEFDDKRARSMEKRLARLAPMRESLHLLMRMVLAGLPQDVRILCVGAGAGPEIMDLALANPGWRFTAVEPSGSMLDACRQQAEKNGIAERCSFHQGYLDSLPDSEGFDAATSLLVSQFISDRDQRSDFFRQISSRLKPSGVLINADLAADINSAEYTQLKQAWVEAMKFAEVPAEETAGLEKNVSILPVNEIESIITAGGFVEPVLFYQNLLIHAWFAKLSA